MRRTVPGGGHQRIVIPQQITSYLFLPASIYITPGRFSFS